MSYFGRFFWSKVHRPSLQAVFIAFFTVICFLNLFLHCSGSIQPGSNAELSSFSQESQSKLVRASATELFPEGATTKLFPNEQFDSPSVEQATETQSSISSKSTSKLVQEAELMVQRMTNLKSKKQPKKGQHGHKEDEVFELLKEQDHLNGVNNVDSEVDLHLTTVENASGDQSTFSPIAFLGAVPTTEAPKDQSHEDYDDNEGSHEEDEEDEIDDEDIIDTIVLNSDKPRIQELPFCKQRGTTSTPPSADNLIVAKRKGGKFNGKQIVIATLDGKISFLDQSGKMLWSFCTGHFFSSTISSIQLSEHGKLIKLIPSLSGGLYKYDGQSLQAMPLTAESLLRKSFKLANDVVITGGKEVRTFGVDINSGMVKYECGMDGCKSKISEQVEISTAGANDTDDNIVLVVKKQLQTVRAIESTTGTERWNFSVATHELALAGLQKGCYEGADTPLEGSEKNHSAITKFFRMVIPEGIIFGADEGNKVVWQHQFDSPISQAWVLENGRLTVIDPIKCAPLMEELPSLYVGIHKQQLYVQESQTTARKVKTAFELTHDQNGDSLENMNQKRLEWKPILTVAVPDDNTALTTIHDNPFFVYDRDEIVYPAIEHNGSSPETETVCPNDKTDPHAQGDRGPPDSFLEDAGIMLTLATLLLYWKEVLGISFLTALILLIPVAKLVRNRTARQLIAYYRERIAIMTLFQQQAQNERALVLYHGQNSTESASTAFSNATSTTFLTDDSPSFENLNKSLSRMRTTSASSTRSFVEDQVVPFLSQYIKEFEPIQCLGRGGFGVVFEARKKIDDRCYAVKRIPLPNRAKSRDRVMREVKALAKLDHKNIVRYFNAWIENPPLGWLEKNDPLWNQIIASSPSPTTEYPSEIASEDFLHPRNKFRKDYAEISLSGFTPEKDFNGDNNDDSFIVFANAEEDEEEESQTPPANSTKVIDISSNNNEGDCELNDKNWNSAKDGNNMFYKDNSFEHSKFFVRPTTLDIPSSSSSNKSSYSDQFENNDSPTGVMYLYIQQELCQKRTLQEWLAREKERDLGQVMKMFIQIVEAVEYIHSNRLIHRDLKPGNIFLQTSSVNTDPEGEDTNDEMTVKIGDFGLVTTSAVQDDANSDSISGGGDTKSNKLTGLVGTQLYMSYEQSQRKSYDHKVDIYSLGLIFFELIVPFTTGMERFDLLMKVRRLEIPQFFLEGYPEEYKLIRQMVSHNSQHRPEATEIKYWLSRRLESLNSEHAWTESASKWHRSKSTQSADRMFKSRQVTKMLKAHSFV